MERDLALRKLATWARSTSSGFCGQGGVTPSKSLDQPRYRLDFFQFSSAASQLLAKIREGGVFSGLSVLLRTGK